MSIGKGFSSATRRLLVVALLAGTVVIVIIGSAAAVTFFDNITIGFREAGIVVGIVCGLFNIDKTWQKL